MIVTPLAADRPPSVNAETGKGHGGSVVPVGQQGRDSAIRDPNLCRAASGRRLTSTNRGRVGLEARQVGMRAPTDGVPWTLRLTGVVPRTRWSAEDATAGGPEAPCNHPGVNGRGGSCRKRLHASATVGAGLGCLAEYGTDGMSFGLLSRAGREDQLQAMICHPREGHQNWLYSSFRQGSLAGRLNHLTFWNLR